MSGVRPIWLTEDDHIALRYILKGSAGDADLRDWAMSMCDRWHAAPADPMQAAIDAYIHYASDMPIVWEILVAIGYPPTEENMRRALGTPDA